MGLLLGLPHLLSFTNESPWKHKFKSQSHSNHHQTTMKSPFVWGKTHEITIFLGSNVHFSSLFSIKSSKIAMSLASAPSPRPRRPWPARAPLSDPSSRQRPSWIHTFFGCFCSEKCQELKILKNSGSSCSFDVGLAYDCGGVKDLQVQWAWIHRGEHLPSGKQTKNDGKSLFFMGTSTMAIF